MAITPESKMSEMIRRLDEAVKIQEEKGCCHAVKQALEDIVRSGFNSTLRRKSWPGAGRRAR